MQNKKIRIAINGLGRIGRAVLKIASQRPEIEIVAGNDLGDLENIAYLIKYDSVYGRWNKSIEVDKLNNSLIINGVKLKVFQEPDPTKLPWKDLDVDVVIEATGFFETFEKAEAHITAGARRVVISASAKDDDLSHKLGATVVVGANNEDLKGVNITSNGSCTTNGVVPVVAILSENLGIKKAVLNTIHAYTVSQKLVDGSNKKDWRKGRAGAINIIPTSTGATKTVGKVLKDLDCAFDGVALRVPVPVVSMADITFISSRLTTIEEINNILKKSASDLRWNKTFRVEENPVVSSDLIGDNFASIVDLSLTMVVDGDLVKVLVWYENEWGYSNSLVEHTIKAGELI